MFINDHGLLFDAFEPELLAGLDGFQAVVLAMNQTLCKEALPEHFLMALLRIPDGVIVKACAQARLSADTVSSQVAKGILGGDVVVHKELTGELLSDAARAIFEQLSGYYKNDGVPEGQQEAILSSCVLGHCDDRVAQLFGFGGVDIKELAERLADDAITPLPPLIEPFDDAGHIRKEAFDGPARRVLQRIEAEGRSLGLDFIGTPLLLFAMLGQKDGITDKALRAQQVAPHPMYEALLLRLRSLGKKQLSELCLIRKAMQGTVHRVFDRAARDAQDNRADRIGEGHLLRALAMEDPPLVGGMLREYKVDISEMLEYTLRHYDLDQSDLDEPEMPPVEEMVVRLRHRVVGQEQVIQALEPMLKRLRFKYVRPNRPLGVFLFLGPSGSGKTETAKTLAECIYGSQENLVFLEMGQFGSEHDKSMFIGAAPGYVGYGEGQLTNGLRDHPESVILFDEVEKAHRAVFDVLLRFLDEGVISDPAGPIRDGRQCIIVLTSNIAIDNAVAFGRDGDGATDRLSAEQAGRLDPNLRAEKLRAALGKVDFFRPEFINRVDEIVLFNQLGRDSFVKILHLRLAAEAKRLQDQKDREFVYDQQLVDALADRCDARSVEGARVVSKVLDRDIIAPLIDFFVSPEGVACRRARVRLDESGTIVEPE